MSRTAKAREIAETIEELFRKQAYRFFNWTDGTDMNAFLAQREEQDVLDEIVHLRAELDAELNRVKQSAA